jgi:hypothetical protein
MQCQLLWVVFIQNQAQKFSLISCFRRSMAVWLSHATWWCTSFGPNVDALYCQPKGQYGSYFFWLTLLQPRTLDIHTHCLLEKLGLEMEVTPQYPAAAAMNASKPLNKKKFAALLPWNPSEHYQTNYSKYQLLIKYFRTLVLIRLKLSAVVSCWYCFVAWCRHSSIRQQNNPRLGRT